MSGYESTPRSFSRIVFEPSKKDFATVLQVGEKGFTTFGRKGVPTAFDRVAKKELRLTRRNLDMLYMAALGFSNEEIAEQKNGSVQTVKNTFTITIFPKFGVSSREGAIVRAIKLGILDLQALGYLYDDQVNKLPELTEKEKTTLDLMTDGCDQGIENKDRANIQEIGYGSLKNRNSSIYRKLGVRNATQAVVVNLAGRHRSASV